MRGGCSRVRRLLPSGSDERTDGEKRRGQGCRRVRRSVGHEARAEPQDEPGGRVVSTQRRHHQQRRSSDRALQNHRTIKNSAKISSGSLMLFIILVNLEAEL